MKIVVLGGGISTERHVSLVTASSVCKGLRQLGHKAVFVDMFLGHSGLITSQVRRENTDRGRKARGSLRL